MMKKMNYVQPATTVVSVATETLVAQTQVQNVQSNATGIGYGGGNSSSARVKESVDYNVWNDNWSE